MTDPQADRERAVEWDEIEPAPTLYTEAIDGTRIVLDRHTDWDSRSKMARAVVEDGEVESSIIYGQHEWDADEYESLARWAETVAHEIRAQRSEAVRQQGGPGD